MATIRAIDHGYWNTKDSSRNIFKSAYSRTNETISDRHKIIIDGETFYFNSGTRTADIDKTDGLLNKICTLASLAQMDNPEEECYLVAGLPISQYEILKDKLIDNILKYNNCEISYRGKTFKPNIKDVSVFVQGAGALFNAGIPDDEYIAFDIGSYTINVVLARVSNGVPYIIKYNTWFEGIMVLYEKIIKEINNKYNITLETEFGERILTEERYLTKGISINGEMYSLNFVKPIIKDYLENVFAKFKPNYPYAISSILLFGGGAEILGGIFLNLFKNAVIIPSPIFANVNGYYNFGIQKYGHLI